MSTDTTLENRSAWGALAPGVPHYLNHEKGIRSWLLTLDHKRIGLLYMGAILSAFLLGGVFAMLLRTELIARGPTLMDSEQAAWDFYNQMFTLHGAVMIFLFLIPAIPAILGNFMLPIMLGAKDVAFPRLNLLSFWIYVIGGLFFVWVLISGVIEVAMNVNVPGGFGLDTGWTFYTPYSTGSSSGAVIAATTGIFVLGFSSILTGLNFIASIHMLRPRGMTWFRMPLFLWGLYATAVIQILATPVLAVTLLLLIAERALGIGIFDPALGGDPVLYQHFFWFYSHPAVYLTILPAMGVISELISVHARKPVFGYRFVACSSIAIALLGFLVWGHHMFVSGQSALASSVFSILTFAVAVPSAIKTFNWTATLHKAQVHLRTPMVYALGFMALFLIGGLTGVFLGALGVNVHVHDTYFVVAHFHYVMMGSTLFAFLGGLYHWWPKIWGRMYSERWGIVAALLVFIGMNLAFFPQFIAGTNGMIRRSADYAPQFVGYNVLSTIGAYLMGAGLVANAAVLFHALRRGAFAPANPWGGHTLEWRCTSPPPPDNFETPPHVGDPYVYDGWIFDDRIGGYVAAEESPEQLAPMAAQSS